MRRPLRATFTVIVLSLGLVVAAELIARAIVPAPPDPEQTVLARIKAQATVREDYVNEPDLGAVLPHSLTEQVVTPEFSYTLRTDHAGFPNLDPWPDSLDVVVLGNSLITGSGVGYEGQFSTLLGQYLGGRSVLNLGIHGGGTRHQLHAYRKYAAPANPKLVVSTLWLVWEIDNSLKFADWLDDEPRPDFTKYRLSYSATKDGDGIETENRDDSWRRQIRALARESRLLHVLKQWLRSLQGIREPVEEVVLSNGDVLLLSRLNEERLMSGWTRPGPFDIRKVFYDPLETLKKEVEAQGAAFVVALFPSKEELYASKQLPELLKAVEEARAELEARGIATLDLYPVLEPLVDPPAFFNVDMHPNAIGHRVVAEALAKWAMERQIFVAPTDPQLGAGG